jgi:hypothetical protein
MVIFPRVQTLGNLPERLIRNDTAFFDSNRQRTSAPRSLQFLESTLIEFADSGQCVGLGLRIIHRVQLLKRIERNIGWLRHDYLEISFTLRGFSSKANTTKREDLYSGNSLQRTKKRLLRSDTRAK